LFRYDDVCTGIGVVAVGIDAVAGVDAVVGAEVADADPPPPPPHAEIRTALTPIAIVIATFNVIC
jgi:hypothetical protein